jgi:hypothetical protein
LLAEAPFLVPVFAGFLAGCSAVLLRQLARVFGVWLVWLSLAASTASAGSFITGFLWATSTSPAVRPSVVQTAAGFVLTLAGTALAGWALRVRRLGIMRSWRSELEQLSPFRTIRRPVELGVMIFATGLSLLQPALQVWTCLTLWILLWNGMLELGEWELRQRLPACRDYLKRTPRYMPRLRHRAGEVS